ncbi:hypothetical protein M8R20_29215 [Pseudomonas sp. R2.Fl]|nr:hypothetical protein [Pseudomonas sp. R2.Fl]
MNRTFLYPALRGALCARDVVALRRLYAEHGAAAFAGALSTCSSRVSADALSLLPLRGRIRVLPHLPPPARAQLESLCRPTRATALPSPSIRLSGGYGP